MDPVIKAMFIKWGYPPNSVTGVNIGDVCWYCLKVFRARFEGRWKTYKALCDGVGEDMTLLQTFKYTSFKTYVFKSFY